MIQTIRLEFLVVTLGTMSVGCTGAILPADTKPTDESSDGNQPGARTVDYTPVDCPDDTVRGRDRVGTRRLNRRELNNAVQTLFGEPVGTSVWPADVSIDGYDTVAEGLSLSEEHARSWFEVSEELAVRAVNGETPSTPAIMTCTPADRGTSECSEEILGGLARRAWRRPVTSDELDDLTAMATASRAAGDEFEESIALGIQAILLSPYFLFRVEETRGQSTEGAVPLSEHELANRLAFALYGGPPDDRLVAVAEAGELTDTAVLESEVRRMLTDPRSSGFSESFVRQWLEVVDLASLDRDRVLFPRYESLVPSMEREVSYLFDSVLADGSVYDLIDANHTFVDPALAEHYGLPVPDGEGMQRVPLQGLRPGGVLGLGAVLTSTSHASSTSVVLRGKFILDRILCRPTGAPPPGVESLNETLVDPNASSRVQSEQRRANATCAACHGTMDPIGMAFESFDPIGAPRAVDDNGFAVDPTGMVQLGDETLAFSDAKDLSAALLERPELPRCFADNLMTYMVGRPIVHADRCSVEQIVRRAEAYDHRLEEYVVGVALSDVFRTQTAEPEGD